MLGKLGIRETSPTMAKHVTVSLIRTVIMALNTQQTDLLHVQKYAYERSFQCSHIHIYAYICSIHACICTIMYVFIYVFMNTCVSTYLYVCMYVCMYVGV